MKLVKMFIVSAILLFVFGPAHGVFAGDFDWTRDFDIQAQADPSGFRARLATRFSIGDLQVKAVLSNFENPSDAYIALRLGEMSERPVEYVIEKYKANRGNGWGRLAKSLGIKPGSEAFHALKQGHEMSVKNDRYSGSHDSGKEKGKKNKDNDKGKKNK